MHYARVKEEQLNIETVAWQELTWINIEQPGEKETDYLSQHYLNHKMISYQEVVGKVTEQQQKWQALYNSSVSAYNSAQLDVARQGFMQIVESGYAVQGSKTPEQYISMIDAAIAKQSMVSATEEPMPLEDLR